jgi:hypothetical protein
MILKAIDQRAHGVRVVLTELEEVPPEMTIRRILVMHSIQDENSERRMHSLSQLSEYEFFHFFIREESGNDVDKMARALESKIETLKPDLVWVHLGLAFVALREQTTILRRCGGRTHISPPALLHHSPRRNLGLAYFAMGEPYAQVIDELQRKFNGVLFVADRELLAEHEGKYTIHSFWDHPAGDFSRIGMAAIFDMIVGDGDTT